MREILFRVWDKQRREFLSGGEVFIAIQPGRCPKNIFYLDTLKDPDMYKDRFELEQFTGRTAQCTDKIFEGDRCILTLFDYNGSDTQYDCVVEWAGGCFAFVNEEKNVFVPLCNVEDTDSDVEVIGTIHDKEAAP